jgi:hypothetical protein
MSRTHSKRVNAGRMTYGRGSVWLPMLKGAFRGLVSGRHVRRRNRSAPSYDFLDDTFTNAHAKLPGIDGSEDLTLGPRQAPLCL